MVQFFSLVAVVAVLLPVSMAQYGGMSSGLGGGYGGSHYGNTGAYGNTGYGGLGGLGSGFGGLGGLGSTGLGFENDLYGSSGLGGYGLGGMYGPSRANTFPLGSGATPYASSSSGLGGLYGNSALTPYASGLSSPISGSRLGGIGGIGGLGGLNGGSIFDQYPYNTRK